MASVWVYKADGTLQCGMGNEIPLAQMQKELESLGAKVLASEKRQLCVFLPACCGCPTGQVNAYEISSKDWQTILSGVIGTLGFRLWVCNETFEPTDDDLPWPWSAGEKAGVALAQPWVVASEVTSNPVLIRELIGRLCRVYRTGDALTQDYRPERTNIELGQNDRIVSIWFG